MQRFVSPQNLRAGVRHWIMVALQIMLCVVLLVGAGLLIRTLRNLEDTPLGMRVEGLVVFGVNPDIHSLPQGRAFYRELIEKMRGLPGVESMTLMEERIGSWWSDNNDMMVDGKLPNVAGGGSRLVRSNVVGPDSSPPSAFPYLRAATLPIPTPRPLLTSASSTKNSRSGSYRIRIRWGTSSGRIPGSTR